MRHATVAATAAALLLVSAGPAAAGPAAAGGSDDAVPYTVGADGLTLPAGDTFREGGHVNIRYTAAEAPEGSANIHFETLNHQPSGAYVGTSFVPWSALLGHVPAGLCITWVQVEGYDEHFGEGGQAPVCTTDAVVPAPSTKTPATEMPATPGTTGPLVEQDARTPQDRAPQDRAPQDAETPASTDDVPEGAQETPTAPAADDERGAEQAQESPAAGTDVRTDTSTGTSAGARAVVAAPVEEQAAEAPAPAAVPEAASADELPRTGAAVAGLVVAATALLAAGAALLLARRRRRV
ncbi:MAG TPA: LPXTG cell wall anchor domain-containing protein [Isoptericola sp.]|nr:LPXTG cell wall anchor domain-containing protein [Isoptericola sp.]